jgi:four helix bundle protein
MPAKNVKETRVYKLAFELAMEIFEVTKGFPKEEKYSLIDQIRKSSRSVCICLIEAYRKKRYVVHFVLKATESDTENSETSGWLDFSLACKYIDEIVFRKLTSKWEEVGRLLNHMINNPEQY